VITQVRLILAALVVAAILAGGAYVWWTRKALANANARVVAAEQQASLNQQTGEIAERVIRSEVVIRTQAERSVDVVQTAPGAAAPLDPAFASSLRGELERMRDQSPAGDDQHSPDVPGAVR
jgi:uncharacterized protein HemX